MGADSKIEWCRHTFNPWRGCDKVSAGCDHCYAETMSKRNPAALGVWGRDGARAIAAEAYWQNPVKWNAAAAAAGERHRVFCASLADVFEAPDTMPPASRPLVEAARLRLFRLIRDTPHLDWLLLTKRPAFAGEWLGRLAWYADGERGGFSPYLTDPGRGAWYERPLPNVWLGTSVENQAAADARVPALLRVPAAVRFLSCEPLLGPVDLSRWLPAWVPQDEELYKVRRGLHWVIVGGESGPNARPIHSRWAEDLLEQCRPAGVAYFFKQWGEWVPMAAYDPELHGEMERHQHRMLWSTFQGDPNNLPMSVFKVGKKIAGRLLDDQEWSEVPAPEVL